MQASKSQLQSHSLKVTAFKSQPYNFSLNANKQYAITSLYEDQSLNAMTNLKMTLSVLAAVSLPALTVNV